MKFGSAQHGEYAIRCFSGGPLVFAKKVSAKLWEIHGNPPELFHGQPYEVRELNIPIDD
jgi:hypothetical protein